MTTDIQLKLQPDFMSSRQKKLDGLIKRGVFEFIRDIDILANIYIFTGSLTIPEASIPNRFRYRITKYRKNR